jgi:hypothetical protein
MSLPWPKAHCLKTQMDDREMDRQIHMCIYSYIHAW